MTSTQSTPGIKQLHPYQQELLEEVEASLKHADNPAMLQLPTGGDRLMRG